MVVYDAGRKMEVGEDGDGDGTRVSVWLEVIAETDIKEDGAEDEISKSSKKQCGTRNHTK